MLWKITTDIVSNLKIVLSGADESFTKCERCCALREIVVTDPLN